MKKKELKKEIEILKTQNYNLKKDILTGNEELERIYDERLKKIQIILEKKYKSKILSKKELVKIKKALEIQILSNIKLNLDITSDLINYIKILEEIRRD